MKIKKIKEYSKTPKESISNQYPTKKHSFKEPGIKIVVGTRGCDWKGVGCNRTRQR
jgi:hypothetical protein